MLQCASNYHKFLRLFPINWREVYSSMPVKKRSIADIANSNSNQSEDKMEVDTSASTPPSSASAALKGLKGL